MFTHYGKLVCLVCVCLCVCVCVCQSPSRSRLSVIPLTVAQQTPLSMESSRQEYQSGLPCPSPGDLPARDRTCISCISCIGRQVFYHQHHLGSPFGLQWIKKHLVRPPKSLINSSSSLPLCLNAFYLKISVGMTPPFVPPFISLTIFNGLCQHL